MIKTLAVLRTVFLISIVAYTVWATPLSFGVPTDGEALSTCRTSLPLLRNAAWIAIGWIALETLVGWWMASRRPRLHTPVPKPGGEPPFAPPGHG